MGGAFLKYMRVLEKDRKNPVCLRRRLGDRVGSVVQKPVPPQLQRRRLGLPRAGHPVRAGRCGRKQDRIEE